MARRASYRGLLLAVSQACPTMSPRARARCSAMSQPLYLRPWSQYKFCIATQFVPRAVSHVSPTLSQTVSQYWRAVSRPKVCPSAKIQKFVSRHSPPQWPGPRARTSRLTRKPALSYPSCAVSWPLFWPYRGRACLTMHACCAPPSPACHDTVHCIVTQHQNGQ